MPDRRRTRERQLGRLAARRAAERQVKRRRRAIAAVVGIVLSVTVVVIVVVALGGGDEPDRAAGPSSTPFSLTPGSVIACGGNAPEAASVPKKRFSKPPQITIDTRKRYVLTMITSCGAMEMELDPSIAPNAVNSLVFLTRQKFFDGLTFHRIVQNILIQGGDPDAGALEPDQPKPGGPGYRTVDPPPPGVQYREGDVVMAKDQAEAPGTAGSQFFIVRGDAAELNSAGTYALVGHLTSGLEIAQTIDELPVRTGGTEDGQPLQIVYIEKVTVAPA
jgi:cyclophilin family peptidyl-prolyl cis-trans isomerase